MIIRNFASGILELRISHADFPPGELFDFAERQNPRRAFLFVSKVLGRHIPARPSLMRRVWRILAPRIHFEKNAVPIFVGMAETAIALASGIFRECGHPEALFLADTRHDFPQRPALAVFEENHSHAVNHSLYYPEGEELHDKGIHIIAVDDEMTTGNTFRNLHAVLTRNGYDIRKFTKVVLTDWSGGEDAISLARGEWKWTWTSSPQSLPRTKFPENPQISITARQDWGRFGSRDICLRAWPHMHAFGGEKILVLGTGEFVWPPFLLAERLEKEGGDVLFGATTRSPINTGMAIHSKLEFPDNYGMGIPNYLYNVNSADFDRILLCVETGQDSVDQALLRALEKVEILEY